MAALNVVGQGGNSSGEGGGSYKPRLKIRPASRDRAFDMACSYLLCEHVPYTDNRTTFTGDGLRQT
jgi:hypothetical protein